jgi:osmotically inducible protein OsmC
MIERTSTAEWSGSLAGGAGVMRLGSGAYEGTYSFGSRFGNEKGTNPEELIAAAHAGCFSMALSLLLGKQGYAPSRIRTEAKVILEKEGEGYRITRIHLHNEGDVPGIEPGDYRTYAEAAKRDCPVSRLLTGAEISLDASLVEPTSRAEPSLGEGAPPTL